MYLPLCQTSWELSQCYIEIVVLKMFRMAVKQTLHYTAT